LRAFEQFDENNQSPNDDLKTLSETVFKIAAMMTADSNLDAQ